MISVSEPLRASELRYRRLFESAKDGILILDATTGRIEDVNPYLIDLLGLTYEQFIGREVWELGLFKHIVANKNKFLELQKHKYVRYDDLPLETLDGRQIAVEFVSNVYLENQKKVIQCNIRDISDRRYLESQILRTQRMESIGTLAGGIAHDLNNVLTPILMAIALLDEKLTDTEDLELLATLESSAKHGAELVRQVLGFARGIEGERNLVSPINVMNNIQAILRDTFPKNIQFRFEPVTDLWMVTGDATQLQQVFTNFCVNARDAMPEGGTLNVTMQNTSVSDPGIGMNPDARPGPYVQVSIDDNGTGIPPKVLEGIFEPFFTTKAFGKGTGMGLSTSMAIVKSHGGFITVASEISRGTAFEIFLPANTPVKAVEASDPHPSRFPRGKGEVVLVVDDDVNICAIAEKMLEHFGYRVRTALNGAEALAIYEEHWADIDVVLTDMSMPVMDGAATLTALKKINPGVKAIASSGLTQCGQHPGAMKAGFKYFLSKPYTAATLLNMMAAALGPPA
ncbi:MAG: response regulator [Verrucomicrobia bacterium]|nr:response regulator [Verrucomicrobiota bacterium]MCH8527324.1 response regulator [Kiritimatiellia bacterium]